MTRLASVAPLSMIEGMRLRVFAATQSLMPLTVEGSDIDFCETSAPVARMWPSRSGISRSFGSNTAALAKVNVAPSLPARSSSAISCRRLVKSVAASTLLSKPSTRCAVARNLSSVPTSSSAIAAATPAGETIAVSPGRVCRRSTRLVDSLTCADRIRSDSSGAAFAAVATSSASALTAARTDQTFIVNS